MKIVKLTEKNEKEILEEVASFLRSGKLIILPTDTVYGIVGDATNEKVIKKVFSLKKRPEEKAFPIFVRDIAAARKIAYISDAKAQIIEKFWPGPYTFIFSRKENLPAILSGGLETIGIRVPDHPFLLALLRSVEFPLVQTSANLSGAEPAQNGDEIQKYFLGSAYEPELFIDGGALNGRQSTIIDFSSDAPKLLRGSAKTLQEFDMLVKELTISKNA